MFRLVNDMGFQVELDNGYTISVMFSPFSYCSNSKFAKDYHHKLLGDRYEQFTDCPNAETAVKDTVTGKFIPIDGEDVQGYQTVNELIVLIDKVKDYPYTDSKIAQVKEKERAMSNKRFRDFFKE
tara:strand:+ start:1239 stop:1613 length:375 start_codon:yes stop_codon:yes gene_type:complete